MPTKTHYEIFFELFEKWRTYLNLPEISIRPDKRYDCHACIETSTEWGKDGEYTLICNPKRLMEWNLHLLRGGIFHELGHIIHNMPYDTPHEMVQSEKEAEKFSLEMLQINYPTSYKYTIKDVKKRNLENEKWRNKNAIHFAAYMQIDDYIV